MDITTCEGYQHLLSAVEDDEKRSPGFHDYRAKLAWAVERAQQYAAVTGLDAAEILNAWEKARDYWYMNYYQDCNQPLLTNSNVRIFDTVEDLNKSIGKSGFRCPRCGGVSKSPYECNSGLEMSKDAICDWKSYGLFGTLGKGAFVFVKAVALGSDIFMPVAWESEEVKACAPDCKN